MYSIALRFAENFAPAEGTIAAHQKMIDKNGFVWYGKMGNMVSDSNILKVLSENDPKILLIHSGGQDRYWAYITDIKKERPSLEEIPEYYRELACNFRTWFRVTHFEKAEKGIMARCIVSSSRASLSEASKHSMSPYFLIEANE